MKRSVAIGIASILGIVPLVTSAGASTPTTLTGLSASQVLNVSLKAANAQKSATTIESALDNQVRVVISSGLRSGYALERLGGHEDEFIYVNGVVYAKFDPTLVHLNYGVTDNSVANKWISVTKGNKFFNYFSTDLTLPSLLLVMHPGGTLGFSAPATINSVSVIGVTGTFGAPKVGVGGTETLYVSTVAPFLPVQLLIMESKSGVTANVTFTPKNWGDAVSVVAPKNFTQINRTNLPR